VKACPPVTAEAANGSPRFEPNWRTYKCANSGRFPVYAGPTFVCPTSLSEVRAGIKPWLAPWRRQSRTGRPLRFRNDFAHPAFVTVSGLFPSELPVGFLKGISSDHHRFAETRKGAPTNWAGTPDASHLGLSKRFAKPFFAIFPANTGLSCRSRSKIVTSVPPSRPGPSSTKSPLG